MLPCRTRRPGAKPRRNETLRCLFLRHRSVIAYITGHQHDNEVTPYPRPGGGGFWEIVTASHIDWPQQSRLIDLFDNRDGTLSLFGSMIEHAGAPDPGTRPASHAGPADAAGGHADRLHLPRARLQRPELQLGQRRPVRERGSPQRLRGRGARPQRRAAAAQPVPARAAVRPPEGLG